jgi:hypothetical protein
VCVRNSLYIKEDFLRAPATPREFAFSYPIRWFILCEHPWHWQHGQVCVRNSL